MLRRLDHVGIAVPDAGAALRQLQKVLGLAHLYSEAIPQEGVTAHFLDAKTARLEVLEATRPDSPVARFVAKRKGGLHHVAFAVADIHAEFRRLKDLGFTPLSAEPTRGAAGKYIFFLHPKQTAGILVEFCQEAADASAAASVVLVSSTPCPSLLTRLRRLGTTVVAHDFSTWHDSRQIPAPAHMVLVGGVRRDAARVLRSGPKACLSYALHLLDSADMLPVIEHTVPLLISAPDTHQETAVQLFARCPGSTLCILPTDQQVPVRVDPAALAQVLAGHFRAAAT